MFECGFDERANGKRFHKAHIEAALIKRGGNNERQNEGFKADKTG